MTMSEHFVFVDKWLTLHEAITVYTISRIDGIHEALLYEKALHRLNSKQVSQDFVGCTLPANTVTDVCHSRDGSTLQINRYIHYCHCSALKINKINRTIIRLCTAYIHFVFAWFHLMTVETVKSADDVPPVQQHPFLHRHGIHIYTIN